MTGGHFLDIVLEFTDSVWIRHIQNNIYFCKNKQYGKDL